MSNEQSMRRVTAIRNGTVIDHVPSGQALRVLEMLGIAGETSVPVSLVMNVPSKKLGSKDIIKVEDRELTQGELDRLALVAPDAHVAIIRAYTVAENILSFVSAPGLAVEIQVRHIGFAGASTGGISGFYGRTGNAVLKSTDNIVLNNATASGTVQAANVTVTGDLTVNGTTTTLDTDLIGVDKLEVAANNTTVAAAILHA